MSIAIRKVRSATAAEWDHIWQECDYSTYFHSREWPEFMNYVTKKNVMHLLRQNDQVEVIDLDKVAFQKRTQSIIKKFSFRKIESTGSILAVLTNLIYTYFYVPIRTVFRSEKSVTILARKL